MAQESEYYRPIPGALGNGLHHSNGVRVALRQQARPRSRWVTVIALCCLSEPSTYGRVEPGFATLAHGVRQPGRGRAEERLARKTSHRGTDLHDVAQQPRIDQRRSQLDAMRHACPVAVTQE